MSLGTPQTRELAARKSDGVHVLLLWHPHGNTRTVAPDRALDAFSHPFADAA